MDITPKINRIINEMLQTGKKHGAGSFQLLSPQPHRVTITCMYMIWKPGSARYARYTIKCNRHLPEPYTCPPTRQLWHHCLKQPIAATRRYKTNQTRLQKMCSKARERTPVLRAPPLYQSMQKNLTVSNSIAKQLLEKRARMLLILHISPGIYFFWAVFACVYEWKSTWRQSEPPSATTYNLCTLKKQSPPPVESVAWTVLRLFAYFTKTGRMGGNPHGSPNKLQRRCITLNFKQTTQNKTCQSNIHLVEIAKTGRMGRNPHGSPNKLQRRCKVYHPQPQANHPKKNMSIRNYILWKLHPNFRPTT